MSRRPLSSLGRSGAILAVCFAAAVGLQFWNNAYAAELAHYPDECTHYVTGLMVREYLASLAASPPMQFAQEFYLRYPLLGLGHWPPGFYALLAVWSLAISGSKASVLALQALLTAGTALLLWRMAERRWGAAAGAAAAAFFLFNPTVEWLTSALMREPATMLLVFLSAAAFARYLDQPDWRWSTAFALAASAAILTQETAICLALVPPLAVALTRRWSVLKRIDFWSAAALVGALVGPWYWFVGSYLLPGRTGSPVYRLTEVATGSRFEDEIAHILFLFGWPLTIAAVAGLVLLAKRAARDGLEGCRIACWIAVAVGSWAVHLGVPESNEPRHVVQTAPVLVLGLFGLGAALVGAWGKTEGSRRGIAVALGALVLAVFFPTAYRSSVKTRHGFGRVAEALLAAPELEGAAVLVSSRQAGEGVLISEIAMRRPDPTLFVVRGQKTLAGGGYRPRMESPKEVAEYLESVPIAAVVLDDALSSRITMLHHEQLRKALELTADQWERVMLPPDGIDDPESIKLYRRRGDDLLPKGPITLEVPRLRRNLKWEPGAGDTSQDIDAGDLSKPPPPR